MAKRAATLEDLLNKPARSRELIVKAGKNDVTVTLTAVGSRAYDNLLAEHPPTKEQQKDGNTYNPDSFAPALIAACMTTPKITEEDAVKIWVSGEWSRGEVTQLFLACIDVCSRGLDVPFTEAD